jgi:hypothetical protein
MEEHPSCGDPRSDMFIQYACVGPDDMLYKKFNDLTIVACISCFMSLLYIITIWYLKQKAYIDIKTFDLSTVTAGDYTIYLNLDNAQFEQFK